MESKSFNNSKEIRSTDDSIGKESSSSHAPDFIQLESKRIQEEGGASTKNKAKIGDKVKRDGRGSSRRLGKGFELMWGCLPDKSAVYNPSEKQEIGHLQKESRSLQGQIEQQSQKRDKMQEATEDLGQQFQELEQHNQILEQHLQRSEQRNQVLEQQFQRSEQRNQFLEQHLQRSEQHNQTLEQRFQQSEQHNQILEQRFQQSEQHNQTLEQRFQQSEQHNQILEQRFQQSEQHNQTLEQRFQQSEQHNQELTQENQDLQDILRLPPPNVPIISADGTVKRPGGWEEKLFSTLFEGREERIQKRLEDLGLWRGTYSGDPYTIDRNNTLQERNNALAQENKEAGPSNQGTDTRLGRLKNWFF